MSDSATAPRKFDTGLEGLRGLCCMIVLFSHVMPDLAGFFFFPGLESVLIFFLISGYVIGRVYDGPYSPEAAREYGWRRFVRLAPMNLLAVVVSVIIAPVDGWSSIIANVFFLQNWETYPFFRLTPMKANWNLWSLNNEVVYYLIFLLLWRTRISSRNLIKFIGILMLLSLTGWLWRYVQPKFITAYCFGAIFWCTGLWLAWYGKSPTSPEDRGAKLPWISIWLLFVATVELRVPFHILDYFGYGWAKHSQISVVNLAIFPLAFIILTGATSRTLPLPRLWWTLALVQPLVMLEWNALRNGDLHWLMPDKFGGAPGLLTLAALLLWPVKFTNRWLTYLCPIGLISYGIYIFQAPAINLTTRMGFVFTGSLGNFLISFVIILGLTFAMAYIAEKILQPRIRRFLDRRVRPALRLENARVAAPIS